MLAFDPSDPFPLLDLSNVSYADQQAHAALVDQWLGMNMDIVEAALVSSYDREAAKVRGERFWIGLPVQALLTPYVELRFLLNELRQIAPGFFSVVDLGAGYGRLGFVLARHFPGVTFLGYEVVGARVLEGMMALRRSLADGSEIRLLEQDLTANDFVMPVADVYFLYDYGSTIAIEKTLEDLRAIALQRSITVVGRGGATRDAIERRHLWLSGVNDPKHYPHFSIYRS